MNCTICGFDNPADGRFCKKCGAALVAPVGTAPGVAPVQPLPNAMASAEAAPAVAPAATGIPMPYIIIAVVAVVLIIAAWATWHTLGGSVQGGGDEPAVTAGEPAADGKAGTAAVPTDISTQASTTSTATATSPSADVAPPAETPPAGSVPPVDAAATRATVPAPGGVEAAPKATAKGAAKPHVRPPAPRTATTTAVAPVAPPEPREAAAPAPKAAPRPDRWAQMAGEMNACAGNFLERVVCEQKVRLHYCEGYWGKAAQCPTGPAPTTGG